jgi:septal ring factor EnvC (AmiA/AmiB activator)
MFMGPASLQFAIVVVVALQSAAGLADATEPDVGKSSNRLGEIERTLELERAKQKKFREKATALENEALALQRQRVTAAAKVQEFEQEITNLEDTLGVLGEEERDKAGALVRSRKQAIKTMMALERLARYPPEAMIAQPGDPSDMVRSAVLLRSTVPRMEMQARELRSDIEDLAQTRTDMAERRKSLGTAAEGLKAERLRLASLIERNQEQRASTLNLGLRIDRQVQALAKEAKDLHVLLKGLAKARRKREQLERAAIAKATPPSSKLARPNPPVKKRRPFSNARGGLVIPAVGPIISRYGESTDTGLSRKGIEIETREGAQVVAPFDGVIVFAGEFRGYGELLIIEHGEGYHTLLAGVARIDATLGQKVVAGEPVGIMAARKSGKPALYVELRRNGQPINPLPWLAARNSKVSG